MNSFGTSRVNISANYTLASDGCFLHRMSSLEWKGGLEDVLRSGAAAYRFQTWPDRAKDSPLSDEVKSQLPLFVDGLDVWWALHEFYEGYVDYYYPSDSDVQADDGLRSYWEFRCAPQYTEGLP